MISFLLIILKLITLVLQNKTLCTLQCAFLCDDLFTVRSIPTRYHYYASSLLRLGVLEAVLPCKSRVLDMVSTQAPVIHVQCFPHSSPSKESWDMECGQPDETQMCHLENQRIMGQRIAKTEGVRHSSTSPHSRDLII